MLSTLFREVNEASSTLGSKSEERLIKVDSSSEVSEEDFTKARIHLSNLRCEARTLKEQRDLLEGAEREARERAQTIMKELASCRLKISQVRDRERERKRQRERERDRERERERLTVIHFSPSSTRHRMSR